MKKLYIKIAAAFTIITVALFTTSCESDIEPVYVVPSEPTVLSGASNDIILTPDNPMGLALSVYWSGDGTITLSDTLLQAPVNHAEVSVQFSANESFDNPLDIYMEKGVRQYQFLNDELNSLVGRLGFEADKLTPLYIRVRSILGANIDAEYTNTLKVNVQPYRIRLLLATVLDKDWNETTMQLASPNENGIYEGFMGVGGWMNWWLREANNVVWGNLGESDMTFHASSEDSHWNFWFPDPAGCYFTTVNTVEKWWSGLHIDNLSVSGDLTGDMTFSQKTLQWTMPVNLSSASTVSIQIQGQGSLYNKETTDMGPAIAKSVAFSGSSSNLVFSENGSSIAVDLPAGETTLILDLSNPLQWTLVAGEAPEVPEVDQHLYFSGVVDWNGFDDYLTLYDEGSLSYGGAHYVNSEWGYLVYTQPDWSPVFTATEGSTPYEGTLVEGSASNVPAPEPGVYVMDFSMKNMTYALTAVEAVTFTGLNDDWSEHEMVQSTENPEIFTGVFEKTANTPWGVKVLINHDWGLFFGGSSGTLRLGHSDATTGFDGDNDLEVGGTYILTVDLGKQLYWYSPVE